MNETTVSPRIRFEGFDSDWEEKTFSDLYRLNVRKNDLSYGNEDIISVAKMFFAPNPTVTDEDYLRTYNVMEKGDIAFEGHVNENYAYGRFVENDIGNGIVSHVFQVFSPIADMDIDYWKYAIKNERIMRPVLADSTKTSTMMREIVPSRFLKQKIHVPSLEEQKKIGAVLILIDRLITLYERVIPIFDILVKSRFIEMIWSPGYPLKTIGDVCVKTRVGPFGSALHRYDILSDGPVFVLGTDNAVDNQFNVYERRFISAEKYAELQKYTVSPGDIIITMMGTIGRTAVIPQDFMTAIISSHLSCLTVDRAMVLPEFMQKCMILDDNVASHLEMNKKGSTMNGLNLKIINSIPFICPPVDIQKDFLAFTEEVDKSKFNYIKKYEALKKLKESLIYGMLTPVSDERKGGARS